MSRTDLSAEYHPEEACPPDVLFAAAGLPVSAVAIQAASVAGEPDAEVPLSVDPYQLQE